MGTERSDRIYDHYLSAADKFDYYIVGVAVALVGYLGAHVEATRLALSTPGLEFVAAFLFLLSAFAGFKRIEANLVLLKLMQRRLYHEEAAGAMTQVAVEGRAAVNTSTGETLTPVAAAKKSQVHKAGGEMAKDLLDKKVDTSARWGAWRNGLLLGGLVVLLASRVLPPYLS